MTDGAKIFRFPQQRARRGGLHCPPLDIYFPEVWQVLQSMSQAQLNDFGVDDIEPFENARHFTLSFDEHTFPGSIEKSIIRSMDRGAETSLLVHHHVSRELAGAYLEGVFDFSWSQAEDDGRSGPIFQSEDGIFTMIRRPTAATWPGPMLIYIALVPADNVVGEDYWIRAAAPGGNPGPFDF